MSETNTVEPKNTSNLVHVSWSVRSEKHARSGSFDGHIEADGYVSWLIEQLSKAVDEFEKKNHIARMNAAAETVKEYNGK